MLDRTVTIVASSMNRGISQSFLVFTHDGERRVSNGATKDGTLVADTDVMDVVKLDNTGPSLRADKSW